MSSFLNKRFLEGKVYYALTSPDLDVVVLYGSMRELEQVYPDPEPRVFIRDGSDYWQESGRTAAEHWCATIDAIRKLSNGAEVLDQAENGSCVVHVQMTPATTGPVFNVDFNEALVAAVNDRTLTRVFRDALFPTLLYKG